MARIERQQDRVVDRRSLDFEVERLAQPLAYREAEAAIEADAEGRMNDYLSATEAVEETLDDEVIVDRERRPARRPRDESRR